MIIPNMTNAELRAFCETHHVCKEGAAWLKDRDLREALEDCPRPEWIEWFVGQLDNATAEGGEAPHMTDYYESTETAYRQYAAAQNRARKARNEVLEIASNEYNDKANQTYDEYAPAIRGAHSVKDRDAIVTRRTRALDAAYSELESNQRRAEGVYTSMMLPAKIKFLTALKAAIEITEKEGESEHHTGNEVSG